MTVEPINGRTGQLWLKVDSDDEHDFAVTVQLLLWQLHRVQEEQMSRVHQTKREGEERGKSILRSLQLRHREEARDMLRLRQLPMREVRQRNLRRELHQMDKRQTQRTMTVSIRPLTQRLAGRSLRIGGITANLQNESIELDS